MRSKEEAHDYRYFNEPDLQPIIVKQEYVEAVRKTMPPLPKELHAKYIQLGLSEYDASLLTDDKEIAMYFESVLEHTSSYKAAANWIMGSIKSYLNDQAIHISEFPLSPKSIADLIGLVEKGVVSNSTASGELFRALIEEPEADAESMARRKNLVQESDQDALMELVQQALAANPQKVEEYKAGKKGLLGMFMGEVMKLSKGKADPKVASKLVQQELEK